MPKIDETRNISGKISERVYFTEETYKEVMDRYDSLPKHVRDILKNTIIPVMPGDGIMVDNKVGLRIFMEALANAELESTILTYGADYPYDLEKFEV